MTRFEKLVEQNYGYRLFLDDLPSATKYDGRDHYDEQIPLGYVPKPKESDQPPVSEGGDQEYQAVHVFNHLDIMVTVHETAAAKKLGTYESGGSSTTVTFAGHTFEVAVPQKAVRIVGFEVTPRSIPLGLACTQSEEEKKNVEEHGGQEVVAGNTMEFSYTLHVKHSDATWASRLIHYMNYGSATLEWESFAISAAVVFCTSFCVWCILSSMLNKDYRVLSTLR